MKKLDLTDIRIINFYSNQQKDAIVNFLEKDGHRVILLEGKNISDELTMLEQMAKDFPISANDVLSNNWDKIMDLFWQYVMLDETRKFALIWDDTQNMLEQGLEPLVSMINIFSDFARAIYAPKTPGAPSKQFSVFLLGEGKNFD